MRDALNKPVGRSNDNAKYVGLSSLDKYGKNKIDKKNIVVWCACVQNQGMHLNYPLHMVMTNFR